MAPPGLLCSSLRSATAQARIGKQVICKSLERALSRQHQILRSQTIRAGLLQQLIQFDKVSTDVVAARPPHPKS